MLTSPQGKTSTADIEFMRKAIQLAEKARGFTNPNPLVGALVVRDGKVVGEGYHKKAGLPHAEVIALKEAGSDAQGASLYVNLEPCNHYGRTPPCVDAILESGIKRVIIGMKDPNPLNNGAGIRRLKKAGLDVNVGVLRKDAKKLNEFFITYVTKKRPFVIVKVAQSIDGKIASCNYDSRWVSSRNSRAYVHRLRSYVDAVMVGVNTVIRDNPLLTTRKKGRQPCKIIVDSTLRVPHNARIFRDISAGKVLLVTTNNVSQNRFNRFRDYIKSGKVEIITTSKKNHRVNLKELMSILVKMGIVSILVEGGGELIWSLIESRLVDRFLFFISPIIIGGKDAVTSVEGKGFGRIRDSMRLDKISVNKIGPDWLIEAKPCLPV